MTRWPRTGIQGWRSPLVQPQPPGGIVPYVRHHVGRLGRRVTTHRG
jgi:hypothetical protein